MNEKEVKRLVGLLISEASTESDHLQNQMFISLLKKEFDNAVPTLAERHAELLKDAYMNINGFLGNEDTVVDLDFATSIVKCIEDKQIISPVKLIKQYFHIGLLEAKQTFDLFEVYYEKLKEGESFDNSTYI